MTHNIGEEIAGTYLKVCKNCDFVEYNLYTIEVQGEIDVVGIDTKNKKVFICEVAIHLETGLQYVKDKRPDNYNRFIKKFEKDIILFRSNVSCQGTLRVTDNEAPQRNVPIILLQIIHLYLLGDVAEKKLLIFIFQ